MDIKPHPTTRPRLDSFRPNWYIRYFGGPDIYAIVESGGKQYKVSAGQTITVDKMAVEQGSTLELDRVLLISDGETVTVGTPLVEGARVMATAVEEGREKKIIVFKYKAKVRYRKKTGHRQHFTKLAIDEILLAGAERKDEGDGPQKRRRQQPKRPRQPVKATGSKEV